jgi:hypothetical protein
MLAVLTDKNANKSNKPIKNKSVIPYTLNMDAEHYILIVFDSEKTKVNQYKAGIGSFNVKYNPDQPFRVRSIFVNMTKPALNIRPFKNAEEALNYRASAMADKQYLQGAKGYTMYVISKQNYAIALSTQKFDPYIPFHAKHYK